MEPWVLQWAHALDEAHQEARPFTPEAYQEYLDWYVPRTRTRVTHTPSAVQRHTPTLGDTYPTHRDRALSLAVRSS